MAAREVKISTSSTAFSSLTPVMGQASKPQCIHKNQMTTQKIKSTITTKALRAKMSGNSRTIRTIKAKTIKTKPSRWNKRAYNNLYMITTKTGTSITNSRIKLRSNGRKIKIRSRINIMPPVTRTMEAMSLLKHRSRLKTISKNTSRTTISH